MLQNKFLKLILLLSDDPLANNIIHKFINNNSDYKMLTNTECLLLKRTIFVSQLSLLFGITTFTSLLTGIVIIKQKKYKNLFNKYFLSIFSLNLFLTVNLSNYFIYLKFFEEEPVEIKSLRKSFAK